MFPLLATGPSASMRFACLLAGALLLALVTLGRGAFRGLQSGFQSWNRQRKKNAWKHHPENLDEKAEQKLETQPENMNIGTKVGSATEKTWNAATT